MKSYVYEAKDRRSRAGHVWSSALQIALQDAKRMAQRAIGQVDRAGEVKLGLGRVPHQNEAADGAPNAGILLSLIHI